MVKGKGEARVRCLTGWAQEPGHGGLGEAQFERRSGTNFHFRSLCTVKAAGLESNSLDGGLVNEDEELNLGEKRMAGPRNVQEVN